MLTTEVADKEVPGVALRAPRCHRLLVVFLSLPQAIATNIIAKKSLRIHYITTTTILPLFEASFFKSEANTAQNRLFVPITPPIAS